MDMPQSSVLSRSPTKIDETDINMKVLAKYFAVLSKEPVTYGPAPKPAG